MRFRIMIGKKNVITGTSVAIVLNYQVGAEPAEEVFYKLLPIV